MCQLLVVGKGYREGREIGWARLCVLLGSSCIVCIAV